MHRIQTFILRTCLPAAVLAVALLSSPLPAQAQSAQSVMQEARTAMTSMFEGVDHYMVETDSYTSYTRKVVQNGEVAFETDVRMGSSNGQGMGGSSISNMFEQFDAIAEHGTYQGTETVDGVECHAIRVDDPTKIDPQMKGMDEVVYLIGASDYMIRGMNMTDARDNGFRMRMKNYQSHQGLMLPMTYEMQTVMNDPEMKKQMEEMQKQLESMPKAQRKRMEKMFSKQMEQAQKMASGETIAIEVTKVEVNGTLPDGIFNN